MLLAIALLIASIASGQANCSLSEAAVPLWGECSEGMACIPIGGALAPPTTGPRGQCRACLRGEYCPAGSFSVGADSFSLLCEEGFLCTTPITKEKCPAGYFCPTGTFDASEFECEDGLWCPEGSVKPQICPGGYYCESSAKRVPCPQGKFCLPQGTEAFDCPFLADCPAKSDSPGMSFGGILLLVAITVVLSVTIAVARIYVRNREATFQAPVVERAEQGHILATMLRTLAGIESHAYTLDGMKPLENKVDIRFKDLQLTLKKGSKKTILQGVSGAFLSGRLSAIMGPSGSGKTTFLNAVMGKADYYANTTGEVTINGVPFAVRRIRRATGFVPQDDILREDLTVRENLLYSALSRLPPKMPMQEKMAIMNDVLLVLGLTPQADSIVGSVEKRGISGGQRKRVNIGLECVCQPALLFLDEPTSGLDSSVAHDVLGGLRTMASLGMSIITVIHQPRFSIFTMFDDVLLLAPGGRTVYMGDARKCLPYFGELGFPCPATENPADFFLDVITGAVARKDDPTFDAVQLPDIWEKEGLDRVGAIAAASGDAIPRQMMLPSQVKALRNAFDNVDKDKNNKLDKEEFTSMMRDELGLTVTRHQINALFLSIDKDESWSISFPEFVGAAAALAGVEYDHDLVSRADKRMSMMGTNAVSAIFGTGKSSKALLKSGKSSPALAKKEVPLAEVKEEDETETKAEDVTVVVEKEKEVEKNPLKGLDDRVMPNFFQQYILFTRRSFNQLFRGWTDVVIGVLLFGGVGAIIGAIFGSDQGLGNAAGHIFASLVAFGVSITTPSTRILGAERLMYWREAASGISPLAYFLARNTYFLFHVFVYPLVFCALYYAFVLPKGESRASVSLMPGFFAYYYWVFLGVSVYMTGVGQFLSAIMTPKNATLAAVIIPMVFGAAISALNPSLKSLEEGGMGPLAALSYTRWGIEALVIHEADRYPPQYVAERDHIYDNIGYQKGVYGRNVAVLFGAGVVARVVAYLCLVFVNRARQR